MSTWGCTTHLTFEHSETLAAEGECDRFVAFVEDANTAGEMHG